ncbi:hypothetical protein Ancab_002570 [Ancistrocladus abbreviatus]
MGSDVKAQIVDDDMAVINLIRSDDWVVMLDEGGHEMSSELMAELVGDAGMTGASRFLVCIGEPYGHGKELRKRADKSLKLSSLTLSHHCIGCAYGATLQASRWIIYLDCSLLLDSIGASITIIGIIQSTIRLTDSLG